MKTKVLTLTLLLMSLLVFAQESKHLSFKGVPIDGTLNEYVSKMEKTGFTLAGKEDGVAILEGEFAAYKGCTIAVVTLEQKDLVSKISVVFPGGDTWSFFSSDYFNLKELLTEKYGKPSEVVEKFDTHSEPVSDGEKMTQLRLDRCKYYSTFELENGSIQLSIEKGDYSEGFVLLSYFDKVNSDIIRQKAIDDL
ncbi:hypothetical protein [Saccharicrinis sp. GN24d3]|uniref:hypothetical protein n=1 Tax=Saccharicrinis sp. GN24d3 TaxID=3458416 RepID=UPI00403725AC